MISEKDVNNIRKQFNVDDIKKHSNDFVSVATIVEEMETYVLCWIYMIFYLFFKQNFKMIGSNENSFENYRYSNFFDKY